MILGETTRSGTETLTGDNRLAGFVFLLFLGAYLVYPREEGIKTLGVGPEGGRILVLDLFVLVLMSSMASRYRIAARSVVRATSYPGWLLFWTALLISISRGLPVYGGWALGESRWFFCSILVPVGYLLYDKRLMYRVKTLLVVLALVHSVVATYEVAIGAAWDVGDSVMRFGGGREGLVVAFGFMVTIHDILTTHRPISETPWRALLGLYFAVALVFIQTRSLYLFLPIILFGYLLVTNRLTRRIAVKSLGVVLIAILILFALTRVILPADVSKSIQESAEVALEGFSSATLSVLADPYGIRETIADEYSKAGNTAFRLMAWTQVIIAIDETPYGWLAGMPMGAGFFFVDPSGHVYENLEPHNDYLAILSKVGVVGLLGYFVILGSYGKRMYKHGRRNSQRYFDGDSALLFGIVFLISLFSSLNAEMRTFGTHFWLWLFLGLGIRSIESEESESRRE